MPAKYSLLYHIIISLSIGGLLVPCFSFAQSVTVPENMEQAKKMGEGIVANLPESSKTVWQEATAIWKKMYEVVSAWGRAYILPWLKSAWQAVKVPLFREVEKRKPSIEEELQKEKEEVKQEIKTEASKAGKSIWERFMELIK